MNAYKPLPKVPRPGDVSGMLRQHEESLTTITQAHEALAKQLGKLHGPVTIARERSGVHLHLACPACLEEDGCSELRKKHLTINVSKHYFPCLCHKHEDDEQHRFRLDQLLSMPTLEERGIQYRPKGGARVTTGASADPDNFTVDKDGLRVPREPGTVIPVNQLPRDHPAVVYLAGRGFTNLDELVDRFKLGYCAERNPHKKCWSKPLGFDSSAQGQLVFFIEKYGRYAGWQSRLIEKTIGDRKFVLAPDGEFKHVQNLVDGTWESMSGWHLPKYSISPGLFKQDYLMGYDACVRWNQERDAKGLPRVVALVEGALDAAAIGYPAVPILGSSILRIQVDMVRKIARSSVQERQPDLVVYVQDSDEKGKTAAGLVQATFMEGLPINLHVVAPPPGCKDVGELGSEKGHAWFDRQVEMLLAQR